MMQPQQMYEICARALHDFVHDADFTDVVIGLSGGIDSSVVAVMAVDVLGAGHVHGVLLPGPYSSEHSIDDAEELAENLGVKTCTVSICEPYEAFEKALARTCGGSLSGVAAENTQARCRMVCLMALSNTFDWMLLNTGNKSEAMMGYSTLYGDTAGSFAPIGGLYKTDVYAVARWCNEAAEQGGDLPPIPEHVLVKSPSAELSVNQSDEEALGITYSVLDQILIMGIEHGMTVDEIVAAGVHSDDSDDVTLSRDQVDYVLTRVASYAFKRATEPPFPQADFYKA